MNEFIKQFLADLIYRFKAKNPKVFAIVALTLTALLAGLEFALANGLVDPNQTWVRYVVFALALLLGSRTTPFVSDKRRAEIDATVKKIARPEATAAKREKMLRTTRRDGDGAESN
jgi:cytochrome c biogenesis protein CcdA